MSRLLPPCLLFVLICSACGPMPARCREDRDCMTGEYCYVEVCIEAMPDKDAGSGDAGKPVDAGVVDAGVADAGEPDAGELDSGITDAGQPDAGPMLPCEVGETRACCSERGTQTCEDADAGVAWSACSVSPSQELCNGIDDDCDGTVDDELSWQLPDAGVGEELACSIGVGACASNGVYICNASGAPVCGAQVITPALEVCDAVDNDCDGATDEGTTVTCLVDADNDRYAGASTGAVELCPDPSRSNWGNCPTGYVAPASSVGVDCDDTNGNAFRMLASRKDTDGDTYCSGVESDRCVGLTFPSGFRDPTTCRSTDDCDDNNSSTHQNKSVRIDADGDTYCVGQTNTECIGTTAPTTKRIADQCQADDCNDSNRELYKNHIVRRDADDDTYCSPAQLIQCAGNNPLQGYRLASTCQTSEDCNENTNEEYQLLDVLFDSDDDTVCSNSFTTVCSGAEPPQGYRLPSACAAIEGTRFIDCDDDNQTKWRMYPLRRDQDNDGFCGSTQVTNTCIGANAPAGYRLSCPATLDCRDTNPNATTSCSTTVTTGSQSKVCGSTPITQALNFSYSCPFGFFVQSAIVERTFSSCVDGSCTCAGTTCPGNTTLPFVGATNQSVSFTCEALAVGRDDWRLNVTCNAL